MFLNEIGKIADNCWLQIPNHFKNAESGDYQIMPNHIHGIIIMNGMDTDVLGTNVLDTDVTGTVETGHALSLHALSLFNILSGKRNSDGFGSLINALQRNVFLQTIIIKSF
jgi:REP-associated tyrosine transposase